MVRILIRNNEGVSLCENITEQSNNECLKRWTIDSQIILHLVNRLSMDSTRGHI